MSRFPQNRPQKIWQVVRRWRPDQRTGLARLLTTRPARAGDSAIAAELRDRLADLASDLHRFEQVIGHQIPDRRKSSTSASA